MRCEIAYCASSQDVCVCLICDLGARAKGKSRESEVVDDGKDYSSKM
jgi:hypothetical protein